MSGKLKSQVQFETQKHGTNIYSMCDDIYYLLSIYSGKMWFW